MTIDNQSFTSNIPIIEARRLTDQRGIIKELECSFPRLEQEGVKDIPKPGSKEYENFMRDLKRIQPGFTSDTVITGDVILSINLSDVIPGLKEMYGLRKIKDDQVKYIVKGWSYFNDRKVLVTEVDLNTNIQPDSHNSYSIFYKGYALFDANTFHLIKEECVFVFACTFDGINDYSYKVNTSTRSKLL